MTRRMTTSLSAAMPAAASTANAGGATPVKSASTTASSAPVRTRSASGRPPSATSSAWSRIDFPAPVSPVMTFSPGSSTSSSSSMIARSRTFSVRSMSSLSSTAPAELRAQHVVIGAVGRADERYRRATAPYGDDVAAGKPPGLLPIDGEHRVGLAPRDRDRDERPGAEHHGTDRQRAGGDRGRQQHPGRGPHDPPAGP